jgi:hypothetical protein
VAALAFSPSNSVRIVRRAGIERNFFDKSEFSIGLSKRAAYAVSHVLRARTTCALLRVIYSF